MGRCIFNLLIHWMVPYTGTIHPQVLEMEPGRSCVKIKDRRRVRNHLQSIHAVALMNLGEAASGLAVMSSIPANARAILTHLEIDFLKKARGPLTAIGEFKSTATDYSKNKDYDASASIYNEAKEEVARVKALWRIGPWKRN